jgi:hypothetical protein
MPLERRRKPYEAANEADLVRRAQQLVKGEDPLLEKPRKVS